MRRCIFLTILAITIASCGGSSGQLDPGTQPGPGGQPAVGGQPPVAPPVADSDHSDDGGFSLTVIRNASGDPQGVRISWTRVDVSPEAQGYYIYRDTSSIPSGDPAGHESLRIDDADADGNDMIEQSGSGTQTLTFDDIFNPNFGQTFFYRMTVVNSTSDESDFSNQSSITIAQHTITDVAQAGGSIGDSVTITGTWFGDTQETDKVFFTNKAGSTVVEATDYVSWAMTEIVVEIPYGAADGRVGVQVDGVTVYSTETINYSEPAITTLTPAEDWVAHDYITFAGTDFGPPPSSGGSNTKIFFGGTQAQASDIDEAAWTTTQIKCKVPAAATGKTVNVKVSVADNDSNNKSFIILPHIDSLSGTSGNTGASVTITGTNFGTPQGTGTVTVAGVNATVTSWNNTSIAITIPAGAVDGNVVVNRDDSKSSNGIGYDVIPTFTSFSPARRVEGENVTINGTGFGSVRGSSKVIFNGTPIDGAVYVSWASNQIVVEVPDGAKTGTLTVSIADASVGSNQDTATSSGNLKVILPAPDLTGVGQI